MFIRPEIDDGATDTRISGQVGFDGRVVVVSPVDRRGTLGRCIITVFGIGKEGSGQTDGAPCPSGEFEERV
jgi:hypothetical protein